MLDRMMDIVAAQTLNITLDKYYDWLKTATDEDLDELIKSINNRLIND